MEQTIHYWNLPPALCRALIKATGKGDRMVIKCILVEHHTKVTPGAITSDAGHQAPDIVTPIVRFVATDTHRMLIADIVGDVEIGIVANKPRGTIEPGLYLPCGTLVDTSCDGVYMAKTVRSYQQWKKMDSDTMQFPNYERVVPRLDGVKKHGEILIRTLGTNKRKIEISGLSHISVDSEYFPDLAIDWHGYFYEGRTLKPMLLEGHGYLQCVSRSTSVHVDAKYIWMPMKEELEDPEPEK